MRNWDLCVTSVKMICPDATQYEVEFQKPDGGGDVVVESVTLVHGGVEAPEFVKPGERPNTFVLTITGLDRRMRLRATVRIATHANSRGRVVLHRKNV